MDKELLEAIGKMFDDKLEPIRADISGIKADVAELREAVAELKEEVTELKEEVTELREEVTELREEHEITRDGVNTLLDWADNVGIVVKIPLRPAN